MTAMIDNGIAIRVAYLITLPWEQWPACKSGIIDKTGKKLREPFTEAERDSWSALHRMVWRLRDILAKAPGGASTLARLTATYLLMREDKSYESDVLNQLEAIIEDVGTSIGGGNVEGIAIPTTAPKNIVRRSRSFKKYIEEQPQIKTGLTIETRANDK